MKRIGRFEIQTEIGRGAFGRVFRAFDPRVGRVVAVKVLDSDGDDSQLGRFRNEASAAGNLHHENIVTVHEFGDDNGIQYLVMEYLEGQDLQKVLKGELLKTRTPLTLLQKVTIMQQVGEGLHYAHRHGVLHRDIKPANIMLLTDGEVKIMDFGIARLTRDNGTRLTQQGFLIGTVLYMAPELLQGADVDALCDIWAYGVIYYEVLAGRNPFESGNLHSEMYKLAHEDPPPLNSEQCPDALQPVLQRLLSRDRELRYQSLEDVLFDTEPVLLDLRKQAAEQLLPQAQDLYAHQAWEEAQVLIRSILDLQPQNREARMLRERVQFEIHRRALKPRLDALVRRANEEAEQRNFSEAIKILESASKLDSADEQVKVRLQQVRAAKERNDRANQWVASAREEVRQKRLPSALEQAAEAVRSDPEHGEAADLLAQIQLAIQEQEREEIIQAGLFKARGLIAIESFDEAIAVLTDLEAANPERIDIQDLTARTVIQRAERNSRRRLKAGLESAKELLKEGELAESIRVLEDLTPEFPSEPEVTDLLEYVRQEQRARERAQAIEAVSAQATSLVQAQRFEEALAAIQNQLGAYPGDIVLSRMLRAVLAGQQAYEKKQRLEDGLQRIRELRQRGAWEEALQIVRPLLEETPDHLGLLAHDRELREEQQKQERAAAILRVAQNASALISQSRPGEAVEMARTALRTYPDDPDLTRVFNRAAEALQEQENERYLQSQLAAAAELERRQDWAAALAGIVKAAERLPHSPELEEAERRIRNAMALAERTSKIAAEKLSIEGDLNDRNWDAAFARIQAAREVYPEEDLFPKLLEEGQRRRNEEISALVAEARRTLMAGQLDEAEKFLETHLAAYFGEPAVQAVAAELDFEKLRHEEVRRQEEEKKNYIAAQLAAIAVEERAHNWSAALEIVQSALEKHPDNSELGAARHRIQAALERQQRERRIAAEVENVERMLAAGDWPAAIARVEEVNLQDPDDPAYLRLWIEAQRHRGKELDAILTQARQLFSAGNLEAAESLLQSRREFFPKETEYNALLAEIIRELASRDAALRAAQEKQAFISQALARAAELEARGEHPAAIDLLRQALQRFPGDPLLAPELERLENAWRASERARKVHEAAGAIRREIGKRRWDAALALVKFAEMDFSGEPVFAPLGELAQKERRSEIDGLVARARTHLAAAELEPAEALLQQLLPAYAAEPPVALLVQDVAAEKFCRDCEGVARKQIMARRFPEAARAIQEIAERMPDRKTILELRSTLEDAQQREQRELSLRESLGVADRALRAGQYQDAIQRYTALLAEFPGDAQVEKGLREATKARDLDRKKRLDTEIGRLKKLRRSGAAQEVRSAAALLLEQQENPQVRELLQWAEVECAKPPANGAAEDRGGSKPGSPLSKKHLRWVLIGAVGLCSLAVGWTIFEFLRANPLQVDSSELTFTYAGTAIPAQSLVLTGGSRPPQVRSNVPWMTAASDGKTPARVQVQVDPAYLEAGDYSAQLTIVAGNRASENRVVNVSLHVQPATKASSSSPAIKVNPSNIYFANYEMGNAAPPQRALSVTSENPADRLNLSIELPDSCSWLRLTATSGITPWDLKAMVNTESLHPGPYACAFTLRGKSASAKVTAYLIVTEHSTPPPVPPPVQQPSTLSIGVSSLPFGVFQLGGTSPAPKSFSVASSPASGLAFTATLGSNCNWLSLSAAGGTTPAQTSASVNTAGLSVGGYSCAITFTATTAGVPNPSPIVASLTVVAAPFIPQPVDCHAATYTGLHYGAFTWSGATLEPNAELVIGGTDERLGGGRIIRGQRLPGCDVSVNTTSAAILIEEKPSAKDGFRRVKLRNTSTEPLSSVEVRWQAK
jgi:eukaryotic-like serine/threonine-protein kinase